MNVDSIVRIVTALAAVGAAFITASVSFVNLTLSKELKTSEFRQAWIDGLREDLAKFFGAARSFARAIEVSRVVGPDYNEQGALHLTKEKVSDLRYQAAESFSKIKLRLNPAEEEHKELVRLLRNAIDVQNAMLQNGSDDAQETIAAIDAANEYARLVLKKEWGRVKAGEVPFRIARNYAFPLVSLLTLALVSAIVIKGMHSFDSSNTTISPHVSSSVPPINPAQSMPHK
jgi:hypothetical protein